MKAVREKFPVTIRPARQDDLEPMVALLQELFTLEKEFTPDPDRQRRGLTRFLDGCGKHRCILVAEIKGQVVGMATLQIFISTAEGGPAGLVEDVVVQKGWRGAGVGRRLLSALIGWGTERGLTRLQLLADRTNFDALDFYDRVGWLPTHLICLKRKCVTA